ncbi:MAG TPA: GntR family transcriptional regulator [Caulobacteraceae bacterium]
MHVSINTTDPRPIYVQIMDEVRRALVVGTLRSEDPLPSVRQLAADLRLNPNTVAQAYRELEREGVVYVRRGQGTFVAEQASPAQERGALARDVAARALLDAHRHGLGAEELVEAIRVTAALPHNRNGGTE